MIPGAFFAALADLPRPEFRSVFWKSLGLTLCVLIGLWFGLDWLFEAVLRPYLAGHLPQMPQWTSGAGVAAGILAGLLIAVGLAFLIPPVSAVIAGLFLDDVAEIVERERYPTVPPGEALPIAVAMLEALKFLGIVILGNLLAFALLLVPGVNIAAFFVVNGYLLGREYFEFAAMRYHRIAEAKALRRRHRGTVFLAGLALAGFIAVPVLNLLTPLFAAAFMVHLHQRIAVRDRLALRPEALRPAVPDRALRSGRGAPE